MPTHRIDCGFEEVGVHDARDLDWILEGQEHALARPLLRRHRGQIAPPIEDASARDRVAVAACQRIGKRALAGAVRAHHGMHLAFRDLKVEPVQNFLVIDLDVQVFDFQHDPSIPFPIPYPTLPSRLTPRSFCASTANSMGSFCSTSRQKPLTMVVTASSADRPR